MPPAARITDPHTCPMVTVAVPHVGGPIIGPGVPTVLIGGIPASVVGDTCTCVGPPATVVMGAPNVLIGGRPAARMSDPTAHGGIIAMGCPTVIIGGATPTLDPATVKATGAALEEAKKKEIAEEEAKKAALAAGLPPPTT